MHDPTITCPKCKFEIKLTEALAAPLVEKIKLAADKTIELSRAEITVKVERDVASKMDEKLGATTKELIEMQADMSRKNLQLEEAQKDQAKTLKLQAELEDSKRELDLRVQKAVMSGLSDARESARLEVEDEVRLKVAEKDGQLAGMVKQIDDLKRKAEQGSQQAQGETLELELEETLRTKFPHDDLLPIDKGVKGADILQAVRTSQGQGCGAIIWECKRTKSWSPGWLVKLREDQRLVGAEVAVLVTQVMPSGVGSFEFIDGVWVTNPKTALPVATILRQGMIEAASVRQSQEGQETKAQMVYAYLTGTPFRQRIQSIVEAFTMMQSDLNTEKKVITKQWARRAMQIETATLSTVGMYGDLQGIAGKSLKEIEGLKLDE